MESADKIKKIFIEKFGSGPLLVRSPGRVNLIGEHTDYNNGFVMPAAIDKAVYFALSASDSGKCRLYAADLEDYHESEINQFERSKKGWPNYIIGVIEQLKKAGLETGGFDCVFGGNIPIGAGLSSSAAIEAGFGFGLSKLFNIEIDKLSLVKLAQKAENEFVGVKCGIMDQYANIFGKKGHVVLLDCLKLEHKYYPFNYDNVSIVLFNTGVSHSLAASEYNKRREECALGVETLQTFFPGIESLRDVLPEQAEQLKEKFSPAVYKRCKYVTEEIERVKKACCMLEKNDLKSFGKLIYETHYGLSAEYEVSCPEADFLVELVKPFDKVYGARMMGGGFGGCTINLVENSFIDEIAEYAAKEYSAKFGREPQIYITKIANGTEIYEG